MGSGKNQAMTNKRSKQTPLPELTKPDSQLEDAVRYFQSQPHFANSLLLMRGQLAAVEKELMIAPLLSPERQKLVLKRLDARAEAFVRLVSNSETQRAFVALLEPIMREAWRELTGYYPEFMLPCSDLTWGFADQIWCRGEYWIGKSYEQVDSAKEACGGSGVHWRGAASTWEGITIWFISDVRVRIEIGRDVRTVNYGELGFMDGRSELPNGAWILLRSIAELEGILQNTRKASGDWTVVAKRLQVIRKKLRYYFGLQGDPIPFATGNGYRARMKIGCAPSFRT
jgi:hypothetical protein